MEEMYKRKKKIYIIKTMIVLLGISFAILVWYRDRAKQRWNEMIENQSYTKYNIAERQRIDYLVLWFDVYIDEYKENPITFFANNICNDEKNQFELIAGPDCEQQVEKFNDILFDESDIEMDISRKRASAYGFNIENRITVEWVLTHPIEFTDIVTVAQNSLNFKEEFPTLKNDYPYVVERYGIDYWGDLLIYVY